MPARHLMACFSLFIVPAAALILLFAGTITPLSAGVQESTGNKQYPTRYATIFFNTDEDLVHFTRNIGTGLSFFTEDRGKDPRLTAKRVDELTVRVMKILGMPIPHLHFSLYLFPEQGDLDEVYAAAASGKKPAPPAWYDDRTKSIAISVENVTEGILAHEIVHAVVCSYFGSPPPALTQEILAEHVDRHLGEE